MTWAQLRQWRTEAGEEMGSRADVGIRFDLVVVMSASTTPFRAKVAFYCHRQLLFVADVAVTVVVAVVVAVACTSLMQISICLANKYVQREAQRYKILRQAESYKTN